MGGQIVSAIAEAVLDVSPPFFFAKCIFYIYSLTGGKALVRNRISNRSSFSPGMLGIYKKIRFPNKWDILNVAEAAVAEAIYPPVSRKLS